MKLQRHLPVAFAGNRVLFEQGQPARLDRRNQSPVVRPERGAGHVDGLDALVRDPSIHFPFGLRNNALGLQRREFLFGRVLLRRSRRFGSIGFWLRLLRHHRQIALLRSDGMRRRFWLGLGLRLGREIFLQINLRFRRLGRRLLGWLRQRDVGRAHHLFLFAFELRLVRLLRLRLLLRGLRAAIGIVVGLSRLVFRLLRRIGLHESRRLRAWFWWLDE